MNLDHLDGLCREYSAFVETWMVVRGDEENPKPAAGSGKSKKKNLVIEDDEYSVGTELSEEPQQAPLATGKKRKKSNSKAAKRVDDDLDDYEKVPEDEDDVPQAAFTRKKKKRKSEKSGFELLEDGEDKDDGDDDDQSAVTGDDDVESVKKKELEQVRKQMEREDVQMEREDVKSIIGYLPVVVPSLNWPSHTKKILKDLTKDPDPSCPKYGERLFSTISNLRRTLSISPLFSSSSKGYTLFFDEIMTREECRKWFGQVIPALAKLLLRLPTLLQVHYQNSDGIIDGVKTGLRLLHSQEAGIVFLGQELICALLGCSLFCLFPDDDRRSEHLPPINFDNFFATLYDNYSERQEFKIWCIIHYFEKALSHMPMGFVSFERKVLNHDQSPLNISYPKADFWSNSTTPLCSFKIQTSGKIEDQSSGALEVDFANKYIGGGALGNGCLQEEIRFMINPELIASMLFMPAMEDNEAIEIVGAERFSNYKGYDCTFRFAGDYVDKMDADSLGRCKTRIVAIDALCNPGMGQYTPELLLRETNKAFCGFLDQLSQQHTTLDCVDIGIATGNWGCGAFGGDPEVKATVQWLAASQARRPFISFYTFGKEAPEKLDQLSQWIQLKWTVGDLWRSLVQYSVKRWNREISDGFFTWILPRCFKYPIDF